MQKVSKKYLNFIIYSKSFKSNGYRVKFFPFFCILHNVHLQDNQTNPKRKRDYQ